MPRSKTVTLGGQTYEITQLPMKANREWREQLGAPITQLASLLEGYGDIEINSAADLAQLVKVGKELILGSMDLLLEALFAYAPNLAEDRERIEQEAYDDEALAALGEVVRLAYPLEQAIAGLRGSPAMLTSTKSRSANGDNGTKLPMKGPRRSTTKT